LAQEEGDDMRTSHSNWLAPLTRLGLLVGLLGAAAVPAAYAADVVVSSNIPYLYFEDTSLGGGGDAWALTAQNAPNGEFMLVDYDGGGLIPISIASSANSHGSIDVDHTGNIHFADDAVFIDRFLGRLGIGTTITETSLHVANGGQVQLTPGPGMPDWWINPGSSGLWFRSLAPFSAPVKFQNAAPDNSLVVASSGRIGLGTSTPGGQLHVFGAATSDVFSGVGPDPVNGPALNFGYSGSSFGRGSGFFNVRPDASAVAPNPSLRFATANVQRMIITNTGNVGIGTTSPTNPLQMASGARVTAGGVWTDASSREYKQDIAPLAADVAHAALAQLAPVTFAYRADLAERHVGFVAEEVPALVATADRKGLSPMDIVAVLTRVVQEQQRAMEGQRHELEDQRRAVQAHQAALAELQAEVATLRQATRR
jgi:hypothetical protein